MSMISAREDVGGGGGTWVRFCWVCAAGLSEPLPHYSLFCGQLQTPSQSLLGKCNFRDPNFVTFYFFMNCPIFQIEWRTLTFHLQYKHSGLLTVSTKNCLTPKNPKMYDLIQASLLKMRPYHSQSSRENATPSSGTSPSPLAFYNEVPPPPGDFGVQRPALLRVFH